MTIHANTVTSKQTNKQKKTKQNKPKTKQKQNNQQNKTVPNRFCFVVVFQAASMFFFQTAK